MSAQQQRGQPQQLHPQLRVQQRCSRPQPGPHARGDLLLACISNSLTQLKSPHGSPWQSSGHAKAAGAAACGVSQDPFSPSTAAAASWSDHSPSLPAVLNNSSDSSPITNSSSSNASGISRSLLEGQALLQSTLACLTTRGNCNPVATLSLNPVDSSQQKQPIVWGGISSSEQPEQRHQPFFSEPKRDLQQQQQQQTASTVVSPAQGTSPSPSSSAPVIATAGSGGSSSFTAQPETLRTPAFASTSTNHARGENSPGIRPLDIGRVLGLAAAQLLGHWGALQRGVQGINPNHQQQQQLGEAGARPWQLRLPWQRGDRDGSSSSSTANGGSSSGRDAARSAAWQASEAARQWVSKGVVAEKELRLRDALHCYQNAVALEPANLEYVCRLAKQWSDMTYEEGATMAGVAEVNAKAIEWAERAIQMAPKSADGYMASCVSRGRLALISDNKTKVRLAKEAQEAARTALANDPGDDLAHHLMGRWHFEMAQINFVVRQLIKFVYGAALAPGTFQEALEEFKIASELNPTKLIHRVELGRSYLRMGLKQEALRELSYSMTLEVEDINAHLQKEDAELMLTKLQKEFDRHITWGGFSGGTTAVATAAAVAAAADEASAVGGAADAMSSVGSSSAGVGGIEDGMRALGGSAAVAAGEGAESGVEATTRSAAPGAAATGIGLEQEQQQGGLKQQQQPWSPWSWGTPAEPQQQGQGGR